MGKSAFKRLSQVGIRGRIHEGIYDSFSEALLQEPVSFIMKTGGCVLRESKLRWAAIWELPDGRRVFVKRDLTKGWNESIRYLFLPTKARREWAIALEMKKAELPIPAPLGWFEKAPRGWVRESYYLAEGVGSGWSVAEEIDRLREGAGITTFAKTVKKFHDKGLYHPDFHAGNFLWQGRGLVLTDFHSVRIVKALSFSRRLWMLAHLFHSLRSVWEAEEQRKFLEIYFEGEPFHLTNLQQYHQKIHHWMEKLLGRQWKSRTRRCLKESTEFSRCKEGPMKIYRRRDFPVDRIKAVLEKHDRMVKEVPFALKKDGREAKVSIVQDRGTSVVVKQFCYPGFFERFKDRFRRSKGLRAWVGGHGLWVRGIASIRPLALAERRDGFSQFESFLLMETLANGQELDRYILGGFRDHGEKRRFIRSFAEWTSGLYDKGIYHRDMKTCNILVSEQGDGWEFRLLDLEDVRFGHRVGEGRFFKNLLELNTSTPRTITRTDRLRFYRACLRRHPVVRDSKRFLKRLSVESQRRGLVYVSFEGVIQEQL